MRPRRLVIQGLRSYRQREEIDFTDAGLIAILGDTGAGKSSILEALCVALYSATTWDKRNVKALISSGSPTLDVELEFVADGKEWKVHRSVPAGTYPAATHALTGTSDGTQINGRDEVNARVVELIGLDYDQFLRAVVLPQGRFQALLQATGGERTSILKGIFRLDVLQRVRDLAQSRAEELGQRLSDLDARRSKLLEDPEGAAAAFAREHDAASREHGLLAAAAAALRRATDAARDLEQAAAALDQSAQGARERDPGKRQAELERLEGLAQKLDTERDRAIARKQEIAAEQQKLAAGAQKAHEAGLGYEAVVSATTTIERLIEWLRTDAAVAGRLEVDRSAIAEQEKALSSRRAELEAVEQSYAAAATKVTSARDERSEADRKLDRAGQQLEQARAAERQRDQRREALAKRENELAQSGAEVTTAARDAKAAAAALKKAEDLATSSQRTHAAAHAAAGIAPGEPCPVCDRKLPASWKAPAAPDLKRAQEGVTAAKKTEHDARSRQTRAEANATALQGRVTEDRAALTSAEETLRAAIAVFRETAGKKVDPLAAGDGALDSLRRAVDAAAERLAQAERASVEHETRRRERHVEVSAIQAELASARMQVDKATRDREQVRVEAGRRADLLAPSLRPATLAAKPLADAAARAAKTLETAKQDRAREQELNRELHQAQGALNDLNERHTREVSSPTNVIVRALDDVRRALAELALKVEDEAPPKSDAESPAEIAAWSRELVQSRERLLGRVDQRAKQIATGLAEARKDAQAALKQAAVESEAALGVRLTEVAVTLQRKAEDLAIARGQIALARELDRRIASGAPLVDALRELARLLTDGKFIGHVVDRKQQSLLIVASKLLGDMTKRYGFSQEFQVVDRVTGEPRSVMTLSGGETFLASLALALALVELAGREGGRLDALFLDEGFGSLDANALSEALEALDDQAAKGRLVAVISHLHAVAESIERVLLVDRTPAGSRARWLSGEERAALLEREVGAGLLR